MYECTRHCKITHKPITSLPRPVFLGIWPINWECQNSWGISWKKTKNKKQKNHFWSISKLWNSEFHIWGLEVYILVHALGDFRCVQHARVSVWSDGDWIVLGDRESSLGEMKIHHPLPPRTKKLHKNAWYIWLLKYGLCLPYTWGFISDSSGFMLILVFSPFHSYNILMMISSITLI